MSKEDLDDLYHRRQTVRSLAKKYNVTESWLSRAVPERAPRRNNKKLLQIARKLYRRQILMETINGRHSIEQASNLMYVSERTVFRHLAKLRAELQEQTSPQQPQTTPTP